MRGDVALHRLGVGRHRLDALRQLFQILAARRARRFAPEVDMYVLDHRGVGQSDRMGCPEQEADDSPGGFGITDAELESCAAWIQES